MDTAQKGGGSGLFNLFFISFLALFGEFAFLRYIPANIYLLSYYKNAVLIAIFLGMGTGMMLSERKKSYLEYLPVLTLVVIFAVISFNDYLRIDLDYASKDETIWPEFWSNTRAAKVPMLAVMAACYLLMAAYFVPIGQEIARRMRPFDSLKAYSVNIAGSLAGVGAFSLAGWLWTTPVVWFTVLFAGLLWFSYLESNRSVFIINVFASIISIGLVFAAALGPEAWSPYSRIRVYPFSDSPATGFISTTNGNPQVGSMNFDLKYSGPESLLNNESRTIYELPYGFKKPEKVLVAGAGAGNETAMALRHGAAEVHAVELDPVILEVGRALNPHRPYDDARVKTFSDDARAFFNKSPYKYDLVVIGFLDSQYHLTHMSNIRTENFVYTLESMQGIKKLLTPEGILQLNYNTPKLEMRARLYGILKEVFGDDLLAYIPERPVSGNISYLAGPGVRGKGDIFPPGLAMASFNEAEKSQYPTDDWPFLYLQKKKIPSEYWTMLLFIPLASAVFVRTLSGASSTFSLKYFLLGAGFMLIETKSITSFALFFGSTITVVSIVIAAILASVLLANLLVIRLGLKDLRPHYILILLSLAALYFLPVEPIAALGWWEKLGASLCVIGLPILFSSIVFAVSFSSTRSAGGDLGSNILGTVFGGTSEYASMAFGFKSLYVIAFAFYLVAFLIDSRRGCK